MGANISKPEVNVAEELENQINHHHDDRYPDINDVICPDLLINSDKEITERGDYTVTPATLAVTIDYFIDCYRSSAITVTGTMLHTVDTPGFYSNRGMKYTATSSATGYLLHTQYTELLRKSRGIYVTYTAEVASNMPVRLHIYEDVAGLFYYSQPHSGNGEVELLTVTAKLSLDENSRITTAVSNYYDGATALVTDDYFEVGREKLELGKRFTGWPFVVPAIEYPKCVRYGYVTKGDGANNKAHFGSGYGATISTIVYAHILIPLPNMYKTPNLESSSGNFYLTDGVSNYTVTGISDYSTASNKNMAVVLCTASGLSNGVTYHLHANNDVNAKIVFDAGVY